MVTVPGAGVGGADTAALDPADPGGVLPDPAGLATMDADLIGSVLASLAAHTAVLDGDGTILAVNDSWLRFDEIRVGITGHLPPGLSSRTTPPLRPGANYLATCLAAAESGVPGWAVAEEIVGGLVDVLRGRIPSFTIDYGYDGGPQHSRWFELTIVPLQGREGAVVSRSDITARKETEAALAHQARHDTLTGLRNRGGLRERIVTALADAATLPPVLLVADLDGFKAVNDGLGHGAGDELLVEVTRRLRDLCPSPATIARLGGDEFAILLPACGLATAMATAEAVLASFAEPFEVAALRLAVSVSIGLAVADTTHTGPEDLLRDADAAMYAAKDAGRARYAVFDADLRQRAVRRLQVLDRLRQALAAPDDNGLSLHYQPLVALDDGRIVGVEALARWDDPVLGRVAPPEFITVAEDAGLILAVGEWALTRACREVRALPADVVLSVNVSPRQLADAGILDMVDEALLRSGLDPRRLCLEITESAVMADLDAAVDRLTRLRARGISVALDDFGTGWSSLGQLRRLPVDRLKVDRVFVDALGSDDTAIAVVTTIVALARGLGMSVTAEGIETPYQFQRLRELGVDDAQGYLLGRPAPLPDVVPTAVTATGAALVLESGALPTL